MNDTYLWLKIIHILGTILFLGNIIVTGWWKFMADRTRDPKIVAFAQRQVTLTDYVFTLGGVLIILISGLANTIIHDMDYLHTKWILWGLGLFILSGLIWHFVLIPVQVKQAKMSRAFANQETIPEEYWHLCKIWNIAGPIATIVPLAAVYFMVFKPV
jgi:uncharacterized membrane protein